MFGEAVHISAGRVPCEASGKEQPCVWVDELLNEHVAEVANRAGHAAVLLRRVSSGERTPQKIR